MNKKEIISFRKDIAPGSFESLKERIKADGMITGVSVRFYPGVELDLKVRPFVRHKGKQPEEMFTYAEGTESWISGDDDYYQFPATVEVEYDDEIVVQVENLNPNYIYTLSVDIEVQYISEDGDRRGL